MDVLGYTVRQSHWLVGGKTDTCWMCRAAFVRYAPGVLAGPIGAPEQRAPPGCIAVGTLDLCIVQARRQAGRIPLG